MIGVRITRRRKGEPALKHIKFDRGFYSKVGKAFRKDQIKRVMAQERPTGGKIPANARTTVEAKRKAGRPLLSLIDKNRAFVKRKGYRIDVARNGVQIRLLPEYGLHVQKIRNGRYRFFGPSKEFRKILDGLRARVIKKAILRAAKARLVERIGK